MLKPQFDSFVESEQPKELRKIRRQIVIVHTHIRDHLDCYSFCCENAELRLQKFPGTRLGKLLKSCFYALGFETRFIQVFEIVFKTKRPARNKEILAIISPHRT